MSNFIYILRLRKKVIRWPSSWAMGEKTFMLHRCKGLLFAFCKLAFMPKDFYFSFIELSTCLCRCLGWKHCVKVKYMTSLLFFVLTTVGILTEITDLHTGIRSWVCTVNWLTTQKCLRFQHNNLLSNR